MMKEKSKLRIRKLTPLECFKLQGFSESDYLAVRQRFKNDMPLYHVMGDTISVNVELAMFGEMTDLDYRKIINDYVETLKGDYE